MGTLANSEDPDEMQHHAAFHQDRHCSGLSIDKFSQCQKVCFFPILDLTKSTW